jgi:hypothetical protein
LRIAFSFSEWLICEIAVHSNGWAGDLLTCSLAGNATPGMRPGTHAAADAPITSGLPKPGDGGRTSAQFFLYGVEDGTRDGLRGGLCSSGCGG